MVKTHGTRRRRRLEREEWIDVDASSEQHSEKELEQQPEKEPEKQPEKEQEPEKPAEQEPKKEKKLRVLHGFGNIFIFPFLSLGGENKGAKVERRR